MFIIGAFNKHFMNIVHWCLDMVNVNLGSYYEEIIQRYIHKGYGSSKVEILRMALRDWDQLEQKKHSEDEEINQFIMQNANQDYWNDPKEDKVWNKYLK